MPSLQHFRDRLGEAHATARKLRSEAFVRYQPVVAGQRLMPLTLDTYNELIAFENPFVVGGQCDFTAIFQFIWIHHPAFGQFASKPRRAVMRSVLRALRPRYPTLNATARLLLPFIGRRPVFRPLSSVLRIFTGPNQAELEAAATEECSRLVTEGIGDFPTERLSADEKAAGSAPAEPLPFPLQAQILNLMRRELGISYVETRTMPLKELSQLLREVSWVASKGKASMPTPEEAAVWRDYQAWRERQAAEAVKPDPQVSA